MTRQEMVRGVYFNGLGSHRARWPESLLLWWLRRRHGIDLTPARVDWSAEGNADELVAKSTELALGITATSSRHDQENPLLLVGSSAGAVLALCVAGELLEHNHPNFQARLISGRLRAGGRPLSGPQVFRDMVHRSDALCNGSAVRDLASDIVTIGPRHDSVVPPETMRLPNAQHENVAGLPFQSRLDHAVGIFAGLVHLPNTLPRV